MCMFVQTASRQCSACVAAMNSTYRHKRTHLTLHRLPGVESYFEASSSASGKEGLVVFSRGTHPFGGRSPCLLSGARHRQ